jgi:uroporphyrinogen-III synthase
MSEQWSRKKWILVTRAREQAEETARELRARGFLTLVDPVFEVRRVPFTLPPSSDIRAVVLTSANAAYALGRELVEKPIFAVGEATARAAQARGAFDLRVARGEWEDLAARIIRELQPTGGLVVHLAGRELRGEIGPRLTDAGFTYEQVIVYETVPREEIGSRTRHALSRRAIGAILLYSPRTAATFARLVRQAGLEHRLEGVLCVCLSEAVAEEVDDLPGLEIVVAEERDQKALFARLEQHIPG